MGVNMVEHGELGVDSTSTSTSTLLIDKVYQCITSI